MNERVSLLDAVLQRLIEHHEHLARFALGFQNFDARALSLLIGEARIATEVLVYRLEEIDDERNGDEHRA